MKKILCGMLVACSITSFAKTVEVIGVTKQLARADYFSSYSMIAGSVDCSKNYTATSDYETGKVANNVFDKLEARKGYSGYICEEGTGYVCIATAEVSANHVTKIKSVRRVKTAAKSLCNEFDLQE